MKYPKLRLKSFKEFRTRRPIIGALIPEETFVLHTRAISDQLEIFLEDLSNIFISSVVVSKPVHLNETDVLMDIENCVMFASRGEVVISAYS